VVASAFEIITCRSAIKFKKTLKYTHGQLFSEDIINSGHYTNDILWLFESIREGYGYFIHDCATAHC
jgi:hypothetical protein